MKRGFLGIFGPMGVTYSIRAKTFQHTSLPSLNVPCPAEMDWNRKKVYSRKLIYQLCYMQGRNLEIRRIKFQVSKDKISQ